MIPKHLTGEQYDRIMSEGEKTYKRHQIVGDAYAFHKAFEHTKKLIEEAKVSPPNPPKP